MKQDVDVFTIEILPVEPVEPVKRGRGRPSTGKAKSSAERQKAFRARREAEGVVRVTVDLPVDVVAGLNKFIKFKDETKDEVLAKLVRSQLLRER